MTKAKFQVCIEGEAMRFSYRLGKGYERKQGQRVLYSFSLSNGKMKMLSTQQGSVMGRTDLGEKISSCGPEEFHLPASQWLRSKAV
jgi:hypothetical protein